MLLWLLYIKVFTLSVRYYIKYFDNRSFNIIEQVLKK